MIQTLRLLNGRRVRRQPVRAVIAVLSVAAGVALVASVPVVTSSTRRSLDLFARSLAGPAPLRIIGPVGRAGLDASVLPKVDAVPGVRAAIPLVQAVTLAEVGNRAARRDAGGAHATTVLAFGIDCRIEALIGKFGCDQAALDQAPANAPPLVSSALAREAQRAGDRAVLLTDTGDVPLAHAPANPRLDVLNGGRVAVLPLPVAQARFGRQGAYDTIYVLPEPGVAITDLRHRLDAAVGGWNKVLLASDPPPGAALYGNLLLPLLGLVGLFSLGIGAVLIRNTVSLAVEERRRDLAIASAVGATARVVRSGILIESAALGVIGGLLGAVGGIVVAHPIAASISTFTERLAGFRINITATASPFVFGAILGVIVSIVAAWRPARIATRIDVAAELANRDLRDEAAPIVSFRRGLLYLSVGLAGVFSVYIAQRHGGIEAWAPLVAQIGMLIGVLFITIAMGSFAPGVVHATRRVASRASAPVRLAWANLEREPARTRVMAIAAASALGMAFTLGTITQSIKIAITESIVKNFGHQVEVSTLEPNNTLNIDAKLTPETLAALHNIPGVQSVNRGEALLVGTSANQLVGVVGSDQTSFPFSIIRGHADADAFARGEVLVGPALARRRHLHPGSTLRVPGRTGFADLVVQGIWQDGDFNGNKITMPLPLLEKLWGPQPIGAVELLPQAGVSPETVERNVRAAHLSSFLRVQNVHELVASISGSIAGQLAPFWAMQRSLVLVSFLAVLFTLMLVAVQRRREFGLLAAVGMRPRELGAMVVLEAVIVGAAGVVLGVAGSFGFNEAFRQAAVIMVGYRDPLTADWWAFVVWTPIILAVVTAAAAAPGWRTARIEVVEALRYE